jgi:hypothetical protein
MQHSSALEADSLATVRGMPCLSCDPKGHCSVHKRLPLISMQRHLIDQTTLACLCNIHLNVLTPRLRPFLCSSTNSSGKYFSYGNSVKFPWHCEECRVISAGDTPRPLTSVFIRSEPLLFHSSSSSFPLTRAEWTPFQTHCYAENLVSPEIELGTSGSAARNSDQ